MKKFQEKLGLNHFNQDIVSPFARIPRIASLIVDYASEESIRALWVDNTPPIMSPVIASPTFESEPNVLSQRNNSSPGARSI